MSNPKRSSSSGEGDRKISAKRAKGDSDDNDRKIPGGSHPPLGTVPSLATLASRAVEEHLCNVRDNIPFDAEDRVAERRRQLYAELAVLADEEQEYIDERMTELAQERGKALEHMSVASGKSNQYCTKCEKFYVANETKCSVPGCSHTCSAESNEDEEEEEDSDCDASKRSWSLEESCCPDYECWYENNMMEEEAKKKIDKKAKKSDFGHYFDLREPSKTGYTKCWICSLPFCNRDFEKHYDRCRAKAGLRCGFRPPTGQNTRGYVCVPGHCGKEVTQKQREICYPEDGQCCTVCCKKCVSICEEDVNGSDAEYDYWGARYTICGETRCKLCVKETCYGRCCGF